MRGSRLTVVVAVLIAAILSWTARAQASTVRRVSPTGTDTGRCVAHPCKTIGYAIGQSVDGDTIKIAAGKYHEAIVVDENATD